MHHFSVSALICDRTTLMNTSTPVASAFYWDIICPTSHLFWEWDHLADGSVDAHVFTSEHFAAILGGGWPCPRLTDIRSYFVLLGGSCDETMQLLGWQDNIMYSKGVNTAKLSWLPALSGNPQSVLAVTANNVPLVLLLLSALLFSWIEIRRKSPEQQSHCTKCILSCFIRLYSLPMTLTSRMKHCSVITSNHPLPSQPSSLLSLVSCWISHNPPSLLQGSFTFALFCAD